jgi:hypothetical protein
MCLDVLNHAVRRILGGLSRKRFPETAGEAQDHRREHGHGFGGPEAEELGI